MGHEKGGNVLKCIAEESSQQLVVAPYAFCEEGKGCRYSSSGGPIMDMCLGAGHCGHGALGNGRIGFQLRKGASFAVRDWLGGGGGGGEPGGGCSLVRSCTALKGSQTLWSVWEQGPELQKNACLLGETQALWPPRSLSSLQRAFHAAVWVFLSGMLRFPHNFSGPSCKKGVEILHLPLLCLICQVRQCLAQ